MMRIHLLFIALLCVVGPLPGQETADGNGGVRLGYRFDKVLLSESLVSAGRILHSRRSVAEWDSAGLLQRRFWTSFPAGIDATGGNLRSGPTIQADLNGDGTEDIVQVFHRVFLGDTLPQSSILRVIDGANYRVAWGVEKCGLLFEITDTSAGSILPNAPGTQMLSITTGDFDGDGRQDIAFLRKDGGGARLYFRAFRGVRGGMALGPPGGLPLPGLVTLLTAADVDQDLRDELLTWDAEGYLQAFRVDGSTLQLTVSPVIDSTHPGALAVPDGPWEVVKSTRIDPHGSGRDGIALLLENAHSRRLCLFDFNGRPGEPGRDAKISAPLCLDGPIRDIAVVRATRDDLAHSDVLQPECLAALRGDSLSLLRADSGGLILTDAVHCPEAQALVFARNDQMPKQGRLIVLSPTGLRTFTVDSLTSRLVLQDSQPLTGSWNVIEKCLTARITGGDADDLLLLTSDTLASRTTLVLCMLTPDGGWSVREMPGQDTVRITDIAILRNSLCADAFYRSIDSLWLGDQVVPFHTALKCDDLTTCRRIFIGQLQRTFPVDLFRRIAEDQTLEENTAAFFGNSWDAADVCRKYGAVSLGADYTTSVFRVGYDQEPTIQYMTAVACSAWREILLPSPSVDSASIVNALAISLALNRRIGSISLEAIKSEYYNVPNHWPYYRLTGETATLAWLPFLKHEEYTSYVERLYGRNGAIDYIRDFRLGDGGMWPEHALQKQFGVYLKLSLSLGMLRTAPGLDSILTRLRGPDWPNRWACDSLLTSGFGNLAILLKPDTGLVDPSLTTGPNKYGYPLWGDTYVGWDYRTTLRDILGKLIGNGFTNGLANILRLIEGRGLPADLALQGIPEPGNVGWMRSGWLTGSGGRDSLARQVVMVSKARDTLIIDGVLKSPLFHNHDQVDLLALEYSGNGRDLVRMGSGYPNVVAPPPNAIQGGLYGDEMWSGDLSRNAYYFGTAAHSTVYTNLTSQVSGPGGSLNQWCSGVWFGSCSNCGGGAGHSAAPTVADPLSADCLQFEPIREGHSQDGAISVLTGRYSNFYDLRNAPQGTLQDVTHRRSAYMVRPTAVAATLDYIVVYDSVGVSPNSPFAATDREFSASTYWHLAPRAPSLQGQAIPLVREGDQVVYTDALDIGYVAARGVVPRITFGWGAEKYPVGGAPEQDNLPHYVVGLDGIYSGREPWEVWSILVPHTAGDGSVSVLDSVRPVMTWDQCSGAVLGPDNIAAFMLGLHSGTACNVVDYVFFPRRSRDPFTWEDHLGYRHVETDTGAMIWARYDQTSGRWEHHAWSGGADTTAAMPSDRMPPQAETADTLPHDSIQPLRIGVRDLTLDCAGDSLVSFSTLNRRSLRFFAEGVRALDNLSIEYDSAACQISLLPDAGWTGDSIHWRFWISDVFGNALPETLRGQFAVIRAQPCSPGWQVQCYPVPADAWLEIVIQSDGRTHFTAQLFDVMGRMQKEWSILGSKSGMDRLRIDLTGLDFKPVSGTYFYRISDGACAKVGRFQVIAP